MQNGGFYTFRQDISDAIGGYPINARLYYVNTSGDIQILQSLKSNNTANFVTTPSYIDDGVNWKTVIPTVTWVTSQLQPISQAVTDLSNKFVDTGSLPANPDPNTWYFLR